MQLFQMIRRRSAEMVLSLTLGLLFVPTAHASLAFTFSVTPATIDTGESALLDLHILGSEFDNSIFAAGRSLVAGADLTFSSGDGQAFHFVVPVTGTGPHETDFLHSFTYLAAGNFLPEVAGSVTEVFPTAASIGTHTDAVDLHSSMAESPPSGGFSLPQPCRASQVGLG
jgi:hypothetical protein